jgi:hypothetical protein
LDVFRGYILLTSMLADKNEEQCISIANEIRLKYVEELHPGWLVGFYSKKQQLQLAAEVMEKDPPFDINELKAYYNRDCNIFGYKTFSNLWDQKGLRNYGIGYLENPYIPEEDVLLCQEKWFCLLYDKSKDNFTEVLKSVKEDIQEEIKQFYKENPDGHVSPCDSYQLIPEKIDAWYGSYSDLPDLEGDEFKIQIEKPRSKPEPYKSKEEYLAEYTFLEEESDLPF